MKTNALLTNPAGTDSQQDGINVEKGFAFINDIPYEIAEGETILSFLRRHQGENPVPTLCDAPNLKPFGSCRVCSVDVALEKDGNVKTLASCHTPVSEGTYIYPDSDRIQRLRKNIIELVLTDYPKEKKH